MSKISRQAPEMGQELWRKGADEYGVVEAPKAGGAVRPSPRAAHGGGILARQAWAKARAFAFVLASDR